MIISVEIMKNINSAIASGNFIPISQLEQDCALDGNILKTVAGDVDKPITSMSLFFSTIASYLSEVQKRVKMMNECYAAIQKLQIKHNIIEATAENQEPAIIWTNQS